MPTIMWAQRSTRFSQSATKAVSISSLVPSCRARPQDGKISPPFTLEDFERDAAFHLSAGAVIDSTIGSGFEKCSPPSPAGEKPGFLGATAGIRESVGCANDLISNT